VTLNPKRTALSLVRFSGAYRIGRYLSRQLLPVLTYHHITQEDHPAGLTDSLSVREFDRHIAHLTKHYHVVEGAEFLAVIRGEAEFRPSSVLVTFDDGYRNNYELAFRVLRAHGATGVFFVTSEFLDAPASRLWFERLDQMLRVMPDQLLAEWLARRRDAQDLRDRSTLRQWLKRRTYRERESLLGDLERALLTFGLPPTPRPETAPMSWDQACEMSEAGMTIGAHTATHQILSAASTDEVWQELTTSRARIEAAIGKPCWCFSYPNGETADFRAEDVAAVERAGFTCAFTQVAGFVSRSSDRYCLPRIAVPTCVDFDDFLSRLTGVHHHVMGPLHAAVRPAQVSL
jgi:peptidoglycan/xylan/chitin deacetylase (PgdA/CDA1 family)